MGDMHVTVNQQPGSAGRRRFSKTASMLTGTAALASTGPFVFAKEKVTLRHGNPCDLSRGHSGTGHERPGYRDSLRGRG